VLVGERGGGGPGAFSCTCRW